MHKLVALVTTLALLGCGSSSSNNPPIGSDPGTVSWDSSQDTSQPPGDQGTLDPGMATDPGANVDPGGPTPDPGQTQPDLPGVDAAAGTLGLGEPCDNDQQCQSGLCWSFNLGDVCTVTCTTMQECVDLGMNLLCQEIRPNVLGCALESEPAAQTCDGHEDCAYPLFCRPDTNWCGLPECTSDGDCDAGQECEPWSRRCQPLTCTGNIECENPLEMCVGGACGPPECTDDGDCSAGDFCHPIQLACDTPSACPNGDECFYNELCVDSSCLPNTCWQPCANAGDQCDPATGKCGAPCTGNGDCPADHACGADPKLCYLNTPPMAQAVAMVSGQPVAGSVSVGATVTLDGQGSVDPEGEPLTGYSWTLNQKPAGSALPLKTELGTSATYDFAPDAAGGYSLGLRVTDPGGLISLQDQLLVYAE